MPPLRGFKDDEKSYLLWLDANRLGWVINTRRLPTPKYMVLHRATCKKIGDYGEMSKPGGFTERSYTKICATNLEELREWVTKNGRPDGSFSKECKLCIGK